ncbi:ABC transporter substrate-binding protein [uncultured Dubosiella sp.]|uniref:ABC transporter substrate-binding protein n=1 Tax=uncultured Dubosiella sp. TaxID=1937011 RepID=UPI00263B5E9E|nr:ABC transporter substrate-binding protein [uncultured Dubosiella sp.]
MNSQKFIAGLASAAMVLGLAGCGSSGSNSGSSSDSKPLIVGTTQELAGVFSPIFYQSSYDGWVVNMIYEPLLTYTKDSELKPNLAEEMPEISEDGKTITFKLKDGIKFSDGTDLDANDVKFTFTLIADPSYDGRFTGNADFIEGYTEYHDGDAEDFSGIEVVDEHTVTFHLTKTQYDSVSTLGGMGIISDEQYEYKKGDLGDYKSKNDEPMGSGPYVLNSYDKASGASLTKNENYTGEGDYKISRVIVKTIAEATELTSLQNGDINYFPESIEADIIGPASLDENLTFDHYFRAAEGFFGYNCKSGTTADPAVRQALSYATNRPEFVDAYFKYPEASEELEKVPLGYVPDVYWNPVSANLGKVVTGEERLDGLAIYDYDLDKAKQILDDAGWKVGADGIREKDGEKLTVKFLLSEGNSVLEMLIPIIQKSWKEIGVDLKQNTVDFNTLLDTVTPGSGNEDWNVFFMATSYTGVENADSNYNLMSGDPNNYSGLTDKKLDEELTAGRSTMDEKESVDNYKKAMITENELIPYLPIYGNELFNIYAKNVKLTETGPVRSWAQALDSAEIE